MLGSLLRSHQERAALVSRMANHERANERHALADHLETRARDYEQGVQIMKKLLRTGEAGSGATSEQAEESTKAHEHQGE